MPPQQDRARYELAQGTHFAFFLLKFGESFNAPRFRFGLKRKGAPIEAAFRQQKELRNSPSPFLRNGGKGLLLLFGRLVSGFRRIALVLLRVSWFDRLLVV